MKRANSAVASAVAKSQLEYYVLLQIYSTRCKEEIRRSPHGKICALTRVLLWCGI